MTRCAALLSRRTFVVLATRRSVLASVLTSALASAVMSTSAFAQLQRNFPATALRGEIVVQQPPQVLLNGRDARLAPGSRIRDENNLLVMSGALAQRRALVHYTLDASGLLFEVWLLTPQEASKQPWPRSPDEAGKWVFDAVGQSWSRP